MEESDFHHSDGTERYRVLLYGCSRVLIRAIGAPRINNLQVSRQFTW